MDICECRVTFATENIFSPVSTEPVTIKLMFVVETQTTKIHGQTQTTMVMVDNKEDKVRDKKEDEVRDNKEDKVTVNKENEVNKEEEVKVKQEEEVRVKKEEGVRVNKLLKRQRKGKMDMEDELKRCKLYIIKNIDFIYQTFA